MTTLAGEWLKSVPTLILSLGVLWVAIRSERRASRNESIRARQAIIGEIRSWANASISVLTELAEEIERLPKASTSSLRRLSSLVDQGRLFFENDFQEIYGIDKPPAFRGYRPRILSWLAVGHQLADTAAGYDTGEQIELLGKLRRHFVSDCQKLVSPNDFGNLTIEDFNLQIRNGEFMEKTDGHPLIVTAKEFASSEHERFRGMSL